MNEDYTDDKLARMVGPGCFPLIKTLRDAANARDIEILQVKEKFGTLRFYYTPYGHDEVFDLAVIGAETESAHICEECGSNNAGVAGTRKDGGGWLKCLCTPCREARRNRTSVT